MSLPRDCGLLAMLQGVAGFHSRLAGFLSRLLFLIMLHIERWGLLAVWLVVGLQRPRKTKHICTLSLWQNLKACVCLIFEKGIIYSIRFAKPGVPAKCLEASQHPLLDRPLLLDTPLFTRQAPFY